MIGQNLQVHLIRNDPVEPGRTFTGKCLADHYEDVTLGKVYFLSVTKKASNGKYWVSCIANGGVVRGYKAEYFEIAPDNTSAATKKDFIPSTIGKCEI